MISGSASAGSFGAQLTSVGASFRLWAPAAQRVDLILDGLHPMQSESGGWFTAHVDGARPGALYAYRVDGQLDVPDPASAFQPHDVSGPSELIDHGSYQWRAEHWRGRPWDHAVIIETHVGTFTPEGTYRAMIGKLDHLTDTGFTALELMPVADFAGRRNWGYDGVHWYAPDGAYGRPDDLKTLIDEAHLRGLMVFLDVVYNHFGPAGNYLGQYAPQFFIDAHTPWGKAIDYRVPQVRAFVIENALHWLREYRFDGLRLDAVHAIVETGEMPMLRDLSRAVGAFAADTGRHIHLMLENDDNRAGLLSPRTDPANGQYRAQWNDDYHHAWHVLLTGENHGYYADYDVTPREHIARMLSSGFAYQGTVSGHRGGAPRGEPSGGLPPAAFVNFLQNHDQIGNRARGDRLEACASTEAIEAALAITLLAPMPPMLFMGEEWGSKAPFPFFCDFEGELAEAVRAGRRREFAADYAKFGDKVPDPLDEATFRSAVLDWDERFRTEGQQRLELIKALLAVRKREIAPHLASASFGKAFADPDSGVIAASWRMGDSAALRLLANLSDQMVSWRHVEFRGSPIWGGEPGDMLPPWSVFWSAGEP